MAQPHITGVSQVVDCFFALNGLWFVVYTSINLLLVYRIYSIAGDFVVERISIRLHFIDIWLLRARTSR